jgi:NitT/TauT family transport system substrate-binding protein
LALAGLTAGALAQAQTAVRLASAQNSIGSLAVVAAQQQGLFKAENLAVEIVSFKGGGPAVQALVSGSVDACICAADHAIRIANRGLDGKVLVALTEQHGYALVALADSPAKTLTDLKGKKLGITSPGSMTDNTLRYFIKEAGLDPDSDVQIIGAGTGVAMIAALQTGAVAAGMLTTPDAQVALADTSKFKLVQDYRQLQYPALDIVVVGRWLTQNPGTARAFARAIVKAQQLIQTDPKVVKAAVAEMFSALTPQLQDEVAKSAPSLLATDGHMARKGYDLMVKMVSSSDPTLEPVPYDQVIALSYLPKP